MQRKLGTNCIVEVKDVETLIRSLADTPPDLLMLDWRLYGSPAYRNLSTASKGISSSEYRPA